MTSLLQKTVRVILALCLVFSMLALTACDNGKTPSSSKPTTSSKAEDTSSKDNTSSNTSSDSSSKNTATDVITLENGKISGKSEITPGKKAVAPEMAVPRDRDIVNKNTGTPKTGESDELAFKRRKEILNTPNGNFKSTDGGTTYYVSSINGDDSNDGSSPETAKASLDYISPVKGDLILFERGSVFRFNSAYNIKSGVTYATYGTGEKPAFYGSPYNYAQKAMWQPSRMKNVWYVSFGDTDVASVVFNHGEEIGIRKTGGINQLTQNGDFFHNPSISTLYLYCKDGNPGEVYQDIEICMKSSVFMLTAVNNVVIDNLAIKYAHFGISATLNASNISITNCEVAYCGGGAGTSGNRLGNGIEFWDGAGGKCVLKNNWVYQCFDTGITWQGNMGYEYNCEFVDNLIEYCCCSIEIWDYPISKRSVYPLGYLPNGKDNSNDYCNGSTVNFICNNNISRFSGYGWGNRSNDAGIRGIEGHINGAFTECKDVTAEIKNNIFDQSYNLSINSYGIEHSIESYRKETKRNVVISGNSYYESSDRRNLDKSFQFGAMYPLKSQETLETAVAAFDSNPKVVKWLG